MPVFRAVRYVRIRFRIREYYRKNLLENRLSDDTINFLASFR